MAPTPPNETGPASAQERPPSSPEIARLLERQYALRLSETQLLVAARGKSVWRVDTPEGRFALKLFREGDFSALDEEAAAMRTGARFLPYVPFFRLPRCRDELPSLLTEWVEGSSLRMAARTSPWQAHRLGRSFGQILARLHSVSQRENDGGSCFLHLDYHADNAIVRDGAIVALVDWRNARFGDPRSDVSRAWLLAYGPLAASRTRPWDRLCDRSFIRGWWLGYTEGADVPDGLTPYLHQSVEELVQPSDPGSRRRLERGAKRLLRMASKAERAKRLLSAH